MTINFPDDFFEPPDNQPEDTRDASDLRRAVSWFKSFMTEAEWKERRNAAANRLYDAALQRLEDSTGKGRFFSESDIFGWYLFLADASLDHIGNYEPIFGSRVVPILMAIGRDLTQLQGVEGLDTRVRRLVGSEKRQPNGGLFELLVAAAYRRAGAEVAFLEERPGRAKTHDMNVSLNGRVWAVECKRMETSEYGERERARIRQLWGPSVAWLSQAERSVFCDVHFKAELKDVPEDYLTAKVKQWLASSWPSLIWEDELSYGIVGELDLAPLRAALSDDYILAASPRILELLAGRHVPYANYNQVVRMKYADNPRYVDDCDLAILLRWESLAPAAIDAKARDVFKRLADANDQLPEATPGMVHIGFEAVEGHEVEKARFEKILNSARRFDPGTKLLEYVYCHYFAPECPPDQSWIFDETAQWCGIRPTGPRPFDVGLLVMPGASDFRSGAHWEY